MAAASSPMPVPGGLLGSNQNAGTPTLGNKGAPTPMGRRRESRVSVWSNDGRQTFESSVFSFDERRGKGIFFFLFLSRDCTSRGHSRRRQSFGGEQDALSERCFAIASEMGGERGALKGESAEGALGRRALFFFFFPFFFHAPSPCFCSTFSPLLLSPLLNEQTKPKQTGAPPQGPARGRQGPCGRRRRETSIHHQAHRGRAAV